MSEQEDFIDSTIPNEEIDIYGGIDVKIKKIKSNISRELRIEIGGHNIDYSVVNAIRRTILYDIPIYGFFTHNIYIENDKTKSMYNNDLIRTQIDQLPIFDLPNYYDLENPEIFLSTEVMKKIFGKFIQEKITDDESEEEENPDANKKLFNIEMTINFKNNTDEDYYLSTHDAVLKIDGEVVDTYKREDPISLLVLKQSEEISLRAEANLGTARIYASYEATTNVCYDQLTDEKYEFWFETLGQLNQNFIFTKACIILIKKLENLRKFIKKNFNQERDASETIEIYLYGEEHTLGNLLATILQKCEHVQKAAYVMPHMFINNIIVSYNIFPDLKLGPIQVFVDCIDYLIKLFQGISHEFVKATG